jgi:hypothetical protein
MSKALGKDMGEFVTVWFEFNCTHKCFKASDINFALQSSNDSLKISQISFFCNDCINFRLIGLSMKSLCNTLLVSLFVKFFFNFSKSLLYTYSELSYLFLWHCLSTRFPSNFLVQFFYPLSHLSHLIFNHFLLRCH